MKNKIAFLILILAVFFNGCKKNNEEPPGLAKLKMSISDVGGSNDSTLYTYNTNGTIKNIQDGSSHSEFTYNGIFVTRMYYNSAGNISMIYTYILRTDGIADSIVIAMSNSGTIHHEKLYYDPKGFLIQDDFLVADTVFERRTYTNDVQNVLTIAFHRYIDGFQSHLNYGYFLNNKNTLGNENTGMAFLGKSSANVYNVTTYSDNAGGLSSTKIYTYEYDNQGRITKQFEYSATGSTVAKTNIYSYY